jgi:prophage regulatory protein
MSKPNTPSSQPVIPAEGFVRVSQLIGCRWRGIVPILPISRSGLYAAIREGRIPPPVKLGPKIIAWPAEQVREMLDGMKVSQ